MVVTDVEGCKPGSFSSQLSPQLMCGRTLLRYSYHGEASLHKQCSPLLQCSAQGFPLQRIAFAVMMW